VGGIEDDGLPRRRRSGSSRPRLVLIAHVIHGTVPLTSPTATAWAKARHLRARRLLGSDGRQPSARSALQRFPRCRLRAVSDRAVSSPDPTQRRDRQCNGRGQSPCQRTADCCVRRSGERIRHPRPPGFASHVLSHRARFPLARSAAIAAISSWEARECTQVYLKAPPQLQSPKKQPQSPKNEGRSP
jgi:hypothetical protein